VTNLPQGNNGRQPIYIVLGNHVSVAGIQEIIFTLKSSLSDKFSIKVTQTVRTNCVNIFIDEFASGSTVIALERVKAEHPNTKIAIVGTEFVTSVSLLGLRLFDTFNFFGTMQDWSALVSGVTRELLGGKPPYMHMRYRGFAQALGYSDLLAIIHPPILPTAAKLVAQFPQLPPVFCVYPQIGTLSAELLRRLEKTPVGFTLTGTVTRYRRQVVRQFIRVLENSGWYGQVWQSLSFQADAGKPVGTRRSRPADYRNLYDRPSLSPPLLFNLNPPQSRNWAYSSPMRILRAILLGQIPVVTKRFRDHPIEDVAVLVDAKGAPRSDGKASTAVELFSWEIRDREDWIAVYTDALKAYDQIAREENKPFVAAISKLAAANPREAAPVAGA
jgi:hypothetical protein